MIFFPHLPRHGCCEETLEFGRGMGFFNGMSDRYGGRAAGKIGFPLPGSRFNKIAFNRRRTRTFWPAEKEMSGDPKMEITSIGELIAYLKDRKP